jgi:heme-degrading monooxygenase HmoA
VSGDGVVFVHLAVHHPRTGREAALAESMERFGAPARGMPGFRFHATLRDAAAGVLVGITIWDSEAEWEAAVPAQRAAVEGDDFDELWEQPPDVYRLSAASPG